MFSFFKRKCAMCKRKTSEFQRYRKPTGENVKFCLACSEYAERRAYRKM
jgi:hypothetical protein